MSKAKKSSSSRQQFIIPYTLPKLHAKKHWYVDFCCYDPLTQTMRRKKYMLDGIKSVKLRRERAAEIISVVTYKLRNGWNVWASATSTRQYTTIASAVELYIKNLDKELATGVIREKTWYSYMTFLKTFREWVTSIPLKIIYVYQIDRALVVDFLDYVYQDKDVSARTRNNYKTWLYSLCGWMKEKGYLTENPVEGIKNLKEAPKKRDALTPQMLSQLREYLKKENPHFLLACMMEYYAFIRPNELTYIRIGDIRVKERKILVHGEWSKNGKDEAVGLNKELLMLMIDLGVFSYSSDTYLFGRRFTPSAKKTDPRIFREKFMKVRKALGWSDTIQFYSLKDSGIRDLANAQGIVIARDQARHSDVSTTNRYLKGEAMPVHAETLDFEGNL